MWQVQEGIQVGRTGVMPKVQNILDNLKKKNQHTLQLALRAWFDLTLKQIRQDLRTKYIEKLSEITTKLTDWEYIEQQGIKTLKPATLEIMKSGGDVAYRHLAIQGSFDVINNDAVRAVNKFCSKLVTNVTQKTKEGINVFIKTGIKEGHSMEKIARGLRPLVGLTERQTESIINYRRLLEEKRPGLSAVQRDKLVMSYTNKTHRQRMLTIARTETANAQNIGYCQGLSQVGVKQAELVNGSDPCDICIALEGKRWLIDEAAGVITVHPRCTCAMMPVIEDEVVAEVLKKPPASLEPKPIEAAPEKSKAPLK
jgi:hypothetical protein